MWLPTRSAQVGIWDQIIRGRLLSIEFLLHLQLPLFYFAIVSSLSEGAPTGFHCAFSQIIEFWDTRITSGTLSIQPWKLSGEFVIRDPSLWGDLAISISVALLVLGRSHLAPAQCQGLIGQWLKGAQVPIWDLKHCFRGLHSTGFCFLRLNIGSKLSGVLLKLHVFLSLVGHLWHLFKP